MVWFKVDDGLHKHRKVRKALAEDQASMSLWVVAGSWSSDEGTDGFIPDDQLPWLLPAGAEALARTLVAARLWSRVRGGYQFHQWSVDDDGTKRNPTRAQVEAERRKKAEAGRLGGLASRNGRSKPQADASADAKQPLSESLNPRPDPTRKGGGSSKRTTPVARPQNQEPPQKCPKHINTSDPPACRPCQTARIAHQRWQTEQAEATRTAPRCRRHRGQPAHNCANCRAEKLGGTNT